MTNRRQPDRVLVLGGTGFLGSEIARVFVARGSSVTVLARHRPSELFRVHLAGVEVIIGDVHDATILDNLVSKADHVVFTVGALLPLESNTNPIVDVTTTLPAVLSSLEILRRHPDIGFTYISSGGTVYGNPDHLPVQESARCQPITSYGIVRCTAEMYIQMYTALYGLSTRILRVGNAFGPLQQVGRSQGLIGTFLEAARTGNSIRIFGDGMTVRDYIYVSDVADAVVSLASQDNGPITINVGSGVGHSVNSVLNIVTRVTGADLKVEKLPNRGFDVREIVLDTSALARLIPWKPVAVEEGIEMTWQTLCSQQGFSASRRS